MSRTRAFGVVLAITGLAAAGVIVGAPSSATDGIGVQQDTVAAGSLDLSFAGGKGYRSVPNPSLIRSGRRTGVGLLVTSGGTIRTIVHYENVLDPQGTTSGRILMRGWTTGGWVDYAFWSSKAKLITATDPVDGPTLERARVATDKTMALSTSGYGGRYFERLHSDGRQLVGRSEPWGGENGSDPVLVGADFLRTGALVECWDDPDGLRLQLFNPYFVPLSAVRPMWTCADTAVQGPWLWYGGFASTAVEGVYRLGVVRTDEALAPDPAWGDAGLSTIDLPFLFDPVSLTDSALIPVADGGLYVRGSKDEVSASFAKLSPAGVLDPSFGDAGVATLGGVADQLSGRQVRVLAAVADAKGIVASILVRDLGGTEPWRYRLIRLTPQGRLDPAFGKAGIVTMNQKVAQLALDRQGRIMTLSSTTTGTVYLARRIG